MKKSLLPLLLFSLGAAYGQRPLVPTDQPQFWVGQVEPTLTQGIPFSALYFNRTGGSIYSFTTSGTWSILGNGLADSDAIIFVQEGDNVLTKYTAACALTPNGSAKSATNRATLVIMPGTYALSGTLTIAANFVDIIGLGSASQKPAVLFTGNSISCPATYLDVHVMGISVGAQAWAYEGVSDASTDKRVFTNSTGGSYSFGYANPGTVYASSTFTGCVVGDRSFANSASTGDAYANGTFTDCYAGTYTYGAGAATGYASGKFTNCRGGVRTFGFGYAAEGVASGTFTTCTATGLAFGAAFNPATQNGTASGGFTNCIVGDYSLGYGASGTTASGTFTNTTAGSGCFGSFAPGTITGRIINSQLSPGSGNYITPTGTGYIRNSLTGDGVIINSGSDSSTPTFSTLTLTGSGITMPGSGSIHIGSTVINSGFSGFDPNATYSGTGSLTMGSFTVGVTTINSSSAVIWSAAPLATDHLVGFAGGNNIYGITVGGGLTLDSNTLSASVRSLSASTGIGITTTGGTSTISNTGVTSFNSGTGAITLPTSLTINGTAFTLGSSGTLAGSSLTAIPNTSLTNSSLTVNGISISLGGTGTIPGSGITAIPNSSLTNSSLTVNGHSISLGGSGSVTASDVGLGNVSNVSSSTIINAALTGNGSGLTGLTATQVGLGNVSNVSSSTIVNAALTGNGSGLTGLTPTQVGLGPTSSPSFSGLTLSGNQTLNASGTITIGSSATGSVLSSGSLIVSGYKLTADTSGTIATLGKYPVLYIPVISTINSSSTTAGMWRDVEIKASINNFTAKGASNQNWYWYHSPAPTSMSSGFIHGAQPDLYFTDSAGTTTSPNRRRSWIKSSNTASVSSQLRDSTSVLGGFVAFLKDTDSFFINNRDSLVFSYCLSTASNFEKDGASRKIWHPVTPVKWADTYNPTAGYVP